MQGSAGALLCFCITVWELPGNLLSGLSILLCTQLSGAAGRKQYALSVREKLEHER